MSSTTIIKSLFAHKAWANKELFSTLLSLDPSSEPSQLHHATRILNHVYVVDRIFVAHLQGQPHEYAATNTPETPALADLYKAVVETDSWYLDFVNALGSSHLEDVIHFTFTDGARGAMTYEEILVHIAMHGSYHRGMVGRILVELAVPAPFDLLTRFLHEDDPSRRESLP